MTKRVRFDGFHRDELVKVAGLSGKQHDLNDVDETGEPLQPNEFSSSGETTLSNEEWHGFHLDHDLVKRFSAMDTDELELQLKLLAGRAPELAAAEFVFQRRQQNM